MQSTMQIGNYTSVAGKYFEIFHPDEGGYQPGGFGIAKPDRVPESGISCPTEQNLPPGYNVLPFPYSRRNPYSLRRKLLAGADNILARADRVASTHGMRFAQDARNWFSLRRFSYPQAKPILLNPTSHQGAFFGRTSS